jgi:hypothetical protein
MNFNLDMTLKGINIKIDVTHHDKLTHNELL